MRAYLPLAAAIAVANFAAFRLMCIRTKGNRVWVLLASLVLALPAALMVSNYRLGIPSAEWFVDFRAVPGTEALVGLLGAPLAVALTSRRLKTLRYGDHVRLTSVGIAVIFFIGPFVTQVLGAMDYSQLTDSWNGQVCLQTSNYTCMPASLTTLLRLRGVRVSEREMAEAIGTTVIGTDDWYIKRGLRKFGFDAHFGRYDSLADVPVPCGLSVLTPDGTPHVVVLLARDRNGERLAIGEPLGGMLFYDRAVFEKEYRPNGKYLLVIPIAR